MNDVKSNLSVRNIMKVIALLMLVLVFCPLFMVSCSGQTETIGLFDVIGGLEYYGEQVVKPHFELIICVLLPLASLVVLFLKNLDAKQAGMISTAAAAVDFIVLLIFRSGTKNFCEQNGFDFRSTGWLKFDLFLHVVMIVLGVLCLLDILHLDSNVTELADSEEVQQKVRQASDSVKKFGGEAATKGGEFVSGIKKNLEKKDDTVICFCQKCGKPVHHGETACASCGEPVHAEVLQKAEADYAVRMEEAEKARAAAEAEREARRQAEEQRRAELRQRQEAAKAAAAAAASPAVPKFCEHCGAPLPSGAKFCENCGTPVSRPEN